MAQFSRRGNLCMIDKILTRVSAGDSPPSSGHKCYCMNGGDRHLDVTFHTPSANSDISHAKPLALIAEKPGNPKKPRVSEAARRNPSIWKWGFPLWRKFRTPAGRPPGAAMLASSFVREGRADSLLSFSWQLTRDRETLPACTLHILKVNFRKNGRGRGKIGTRQCTELLCDREASATGRPHFTHFQKETASAAPHQNRPAVNGLPCTETRLLSNLRGFLGFPGFWGFLNRIIRSALFRRGRTVVCAQVPAFSRVLAESLRCCCLSHHDASARHSPPSTSPL
ncbi:hypothetical protein BKA93DRAFT_750562 [Sparassis latifolia]